MCTCRQGSSSSRVWEERPGYVMDSGPETACEMAESSHHATGSALAVGVACWPRARPTAARQLRAGIWCMQLQCPALRCSLSSWAGDTATAARNQARQCKCKRFSDGEYASSEHRRREHEGEGRPRKPRAGRWALLGIVSRAWHTAAD